MDPKTLGEVVGHVQTLVAVLVAVNAAILIAATALTLWLKAKFFQPLEAKMIESAARVDQNIVREQQARALEHQALKHVIEGLDTAVRGLAKISENLTSGAITTAIEQGRQAERIHQLATDITKTDLKVERDLRRRRKEDPREED